MPKAQDITETCDRLIDECDRLLNSADLADFKVEQLSGRIGFMQAQMTHLSAAQAHVDVERKALEKRWFWARLHPSAIAGRIVRGLQSAHILHSR